MYIIFVSMDITRLKVGHLLLENRSSILDPTLIYPQQI